MILSQESYGLYPADYFMFKVDNSKAKTIVFTNRVLFFCKPGNISFLAAIEIKISDKIFFHNF